MLSYEDRAQKASNPAAKALLETISRKKSNLCVSVDVTTKADFLSIIDTVGPYVCLVKTHVDIVEDFDTSVIHALQELTRKHDFLIFEDRKFADIGNTVALQYSGGVHKISSWSHITNAHPVPGPSVIAGLASVGRPLGRGLLLLAEMSTRGSLATGSYTNSAIQMARDHREFVIGFIAQRRLGGLGDGQDSDEFLILTPGVSLDAKGDSMGQQYRTPQDVLDAGCDVIIVGRGIYGKGGDVNVHDVQAQAERYRMAGWVAYQQRLQS